MLRPGHRTALLPLALAFAAVTAQAQTTRATRPATLPATLPADFDRYVARVLETFQVPGIALAVVKDGKVLAAKGYGVRTLGERAPVDSRTLFGIASNTKAFTATALALLVEEGKLEWDAPVIRYLPDFALYDPYVTRELTVRDLLVHRSGLGLGAGDLLWWPESNHSRKEIVRRLRFIQPATSFRSAYAYDNVLYTVAGEVIEAVSGESWEEFVASRILQKVGMTGSDVRHSAAGTGGHATGANTAGANTATTHAVVDGRLRAVAPFTSDAVNPAGGIMSNAEDMATWVMVQLDSGRVADGSRLFSPATTRQLWTLVTPMPIGNAIPGLEHLRPDFNGYALGFTTRDYRGAKMLSHTGGLPGYVSMVSMIPELRLGIVVLTNQESGAAFQAITYRLLDHFLGAAPIDYPSAYQRLAAQQQERLAAAEKAAATEREVASRPSLPLERYAGRYTDAWYGDITITHADGRLTIRFEHTPALTGALEHWQHDTFIARWHDRELRADAYVTFALNPDGTIERARMAAVSAATDFSFDFQDLLLVPVRGAARR
jgi:CubicO group peptidase (beta-lactamase class C family)